MRALAMMPFAKDFDGVFRAMTRACEKYTPASVSQFSTAANDKSIKLVCDRLDKRLGASFDVVKELLESIKTCTFCLADLTGGNQNVLWELGFAMALEKPVILITQKQEDISFDLHGMKVLKYDRDNLDTSLETPLINDIKELLSNMRYVPELSLRAKALAISSGSPTYFLDSAYNIHYMNEAAANMFVTTRGRGRQMWIGKNLRNFINDISNDLENIAAIEKNLQIQTEEIRRLEDAGTPFAIPTYNIEPIILNNPVYGKLTLQKTGVAVRDPYSGHVTGWVVSFNVVMAHDPVRYEKFHETHKSQIQALLYPREQTNEPDHDSSSPIITVKEVWSNNPKIDDWVRHGCKSPMMTTADNYAQKQSCFDFCTLVMTKDIKRYGLESVVYLEDWFFDYKNAEYILVRTQDNDLVGVCRIHMNRECDFEKYAELESWITEAAANGQPFADVGAYLHPLIKGPVRTNFVAQMLGNAAWIAEQHRQVHLYAQVPSRLTHSYKKFLFQQAGKEFSCRGWRQPRWTPIVSKCTHYSGNSKTMDLSKLGDIDREFIDIARKEYQINAEQNNQRIV